MSCNALKFGSSDPKELSFWLIKPNQPSAVICELESTIGRVYIKTVDVNKSLKFQLW